MIDVQQSTGSSILPKLKGAKFFLQFQIARVRTAQGAKLGVADTVEHQLGKVLKVCLVLGYFSVKLLSCLVWYRMLLVRRRPRRMR
jgi:hypothetical protein